MYRQLDRIADKISLKNYFIPNVHLSFAYKPRAGKLANKQIVCPCRLDKFYNAIPSLVGT